jgi:acylglycerol lipase
VREREWVLASGGHRTFVRVWEPEVPVVAEVLLTHGHGEHSERYRHVGVAFAQRGIRLWGYDLRGHGRSTGVQGDVTGYGALISDLCRVLAAVFEGTVDLKGRGARPVFLMGHSFGGQLVLNTVLEAARAHPEIGVGGVEAVRQCSGVIALSPYLRLAFSPPGWKVFLARLALRVIPGWRQESPVRLEDLSQDYAHLEGLPGCGPGPQVDFSADVSGG